MGNAPRRKFLQRLSLLSASTLIGGLPPRTWAADLDTALTNAQSLSADQLAIGGRLIAPVSKSETEQQLLLIERVSSHRYQRTALDEVFFVPLQSGVI